MMDRLITFTTDAATLAVFDLDVLEQRIEDEVDWWATEFQQLPEVAAGLIALVGLGGDGTYTVRIGDGDLEPVEKAYAAEFVTLGLEVVSGRILVGAGECLPGAGEVDEPREVGPAAGMVFTTKVVLRGGEKLLKPVGTLNYRPVLADMNGLAWRDEVEIRVLAVHPDSETYTAELIRKLPRAD